MSNLAIYLSLIQICVDANYPSKKLCPWLLIICVYFFIHFYPKIVYPEHDNLNSIFAPCHSSTSNKSTNSIPQFTSHPLPNKFNTSPSPNKWNISIIASRTYKNNTIKVISTNSSPNTEKPSASKYSNRYPPRIPTHTLNCHKKRLRENCAFWKNLVTTSD